MRNGLFLVIFLAQAAFATNFEVTSHRLPEARDHLHNPAWQRQLARDKAAWDKLRAERGIVRVEAHQTVELKWPLREAVTLSEASVTQLNFYLDHDDSGDVLDWNCGDRAYDGHNGVDIGPTPYPWYRMRRDHQRHFQGARSQWPGAGGMGHADHQGERLRLR